MNASGRSSVLESMLYPIARFCLRMRLGFPEVVEVLRRMMIKSAVQTLTQRKERITVSRIAVMTGLDRRDVKRIYIDHQIPDIAPPLPSRTLALWETSEKYCNREGKPRPLSFVDGEGEFADLVAEISTDVGAKSVLLELVRCKAVEFSGNKVRLKTAVQFKNADPERGFALLARGMETFGRAVEENVFQPQEPRNLHVHTEYDNVFAEDILAVRKWLLREGAKLHTRARKFLASRDKDLRPDSKKAGGARVVLVTASLTELPEAQNTEKE